MLKYIFTLTSIYFQFHLLNRELSAFPCFHSILIDSVPLKYETIAHIFLWPMTEKDLQRAKNSNTAPDCTLDLFSHTGTNSEWFKSALSLCLLFITLNAHWLRCFTAASCFKTLQSTKKSPRHLPITTRRASGSRCRRHLHTFLTLHTQRGPCCFS